MIPDCPYPKPNCKRCIHYRYDTKKESYACFIVEDRIYTRLTKIPSKKFDAVFKFSKTKEGVTLSELQWMTSSLKESHSPERIKFIEMTTEYGTLTGVIYLSAYDKYSHSDTSLNEEYTAKLLHYISPIKDTSGIISVRIMKIKTCVIL